MFPQLSQHSGGSKAQSGGAKTGDPYRRKNVKRGGAPKPCPDGGDIGRNQLDGGGVEDNEPAHFIGGQLGLIRAAHSLHGLDAHGSGGVAQTQNIGADIAAEVPAELRILFVPGKMKFKRGPRNRDSRPVRPILSMRLPTPLHRQMDPAMEIATVIPA
jgi:hypothetical protein